MTSISLNNILFSSDGGATVEERIQGIDNSYVQEIVINPNNPDVVYAGTTTNVDYSRYGIWTPGTGFWRSIDGGNSWEKLSEKYLELYQKLIDAGSAKT